MEGEVNLLRKRMEECKLRSRSLRETARHQRDKSRQLIVACASKLQEKEAVIEQVKLLRSMIHPLIFFNAKAKRELDFHLVPPM